MRNLLAPLTPPPPTSAQEVTSCEMNLQCGLMSCGQVEGHSLAPCPLESEVNGKYYVMPLCYYSNSRWIRGPVDS